MNYAYLPTLNAILNFTTFVLLMCGYAAIKKQNRELHKKIMVAALVCSTCFLTSYLIYHYQIGSKKYTGEGLLRTVYFALLLSHTILAVALLPLVGSTVYYAWKQRFESHRKIAKITFPIWAYVSITGVIVYAFLYL